MAKVSVKIAGGKMQFKNAKTVGELKKDLGIDNYTASVQGETQDNDFDLSEGDFVTFAPAVKGGI